MNSELYLPKAFQNSTTGKTKTPSRRKTVPGRPGASDPAFRRRGSCQQPTDTPPCVPFVAVDLFLLARYRDDCVVCTWTSMGRRSPRRYASFSLASHPEFRKNRTRFCQYLADRCLPEELSLGSNGPYEQTPFSTSDTLSISYLA